MMVIFNVKSKQWLFAPEKVSSHHLSSFCDFPVVFMGIKLNCTHIIPCVSLYYGGEEVEITKYEFISLK